MSGFVVNTFSGMAPRVSPRKLNSNVAQLAMNCYFSSGDLVPLKAPLKIGNNILTKTGVKKSLYRFGQDEADITKYWFHWVTEVNVVRGSIAGDVTERTYFTGDGVPKVTYSPIALNGLATNYPNNSYELGVPAPDLDTLAITVENLVIVSISSNGLLATATTADPIQVISSEKVAISGATEDVFNGNAIEITVVDANHFNYTLKTAPVASNASGTLRYNYGGLPETRVYAVTYVSAAGEEGAPAVSATVTVIAGQKVTLTGIPVAPFGNLSILKKRIYRTATGSIQTSFRFVGELSVAFTNFVDRAKSTALGENIPSLYYVAPPSDMKGLIGFANGMMAAISKNEVLICEPYQPHAWPIEYRYSFGLNPVALGSFGNSIVVLTKGIPSILTGSSPNAMSQDPVKIGQPCLSPRSVVELVGGVMWASDEGLAFISSAGFDLPTSDLFDRNKWKTYNPSSIHAYRWENKYVAFYTTATEKQGFIFDPMTKDFALLDFYADAGFTDPQTGNLYIAMGNNVFLFDEVVDQLEYTWRSRVFVSSKPVNMGYAKIVSSAYPVRFSLIADGEFVHLQDVDDATPFALPTGYLATDFEVEFHGYGDVQGCAIAEGASELESVAE